MLEIESNFTTWTEENFFETSSVDDWNSSYVNITEIQDNVQRNTTPNILYTVMESLVAIVAVIGNGLVIIVFHRERRLRRRTNYYIISLALADFLVGLFGVPFALLADIGLPRNLHACLFTISALIVLCTISIFCLVAVSIDRYWAILHPLAYSRNVRTKTAIGIISLCWVSGSFIGFLPLLGWHSHEIGEDRCYFTKKMAYSYLVFLYFVTIITPTIILAVCYGLIYRVILKQVNKTTSSSIRVISASSRSHTLPNTLTSNTQSETQMLRLLNSAAQKREVKATQNLSIIVVFFIICWIPLYTINCVNAFCHDCVINSTVIYFAIILSHFNSAVNPLLYAYHLKDFRGALSRLFHCTSQPDSYYRPSLISQHQQRIQEHFASSRRNFESRVYVESPVWRREQQQLQPNNNDEVRKIKDKTLTTTDNDSGLNVSSSDLHAENDEKRTSMIKRRSTLSLRNENIFIISGDGMEMGITYEQQNSSLYAIVKRNRDKNEEDSI